MALISTDNSRFFGMDLSQWPRQWRAAGAALSGLPGLRHLVPATCVRLQLADGRLVDWRLTGATATRLERAPTESVDAMAVQMPAESVLERRLMLPPLGSADLAQAVQLEVAAASPFGAEQTVYGYVASPEEGGVQRIDVAITSRREVEQLLAHKAGQGDGASGTPEVWVLPAAGEGAAVLRPVVLQGFGEDARQQVVRRGLWTRVGLAALALMLLGAVLVTPALVQRQRAQLAQQSFAALQRQAAPQIAQREALMKRVERLQTVGQVMESQMALPPVLDMLTRTIPDGAWLSQLRVEGAKLVINGSADDAAALVQLLADQPGVHDVRLSSPATRGHGASKENFIIEMVVDAKQYGLVRAPGGAP